MLTLLIREHTRLAYDLAAINPHWNDERLFQESRRIVIAEYQHITYQYWLPLVIGEIMPLYHWKAIFQSIVRKRKRYCKDHKICPVSEELSHNYNEKINPSTMNGFTTGAFRFLHSLVDGNISLVTKNNSIFQTLRLSDYYFRPSIVETDFNFESLLRGLVLQRAQKADSNFHPEISEYLFRLVDEFGMDLLALDIQRSRDHGIPGYNAYRQICGLETAKDFHGLINEISLNNIERLHTVYKHVNDIDLLVGITMENRMPGSLVGPTGRCLIGEQFYRSRYGDKYFYDNANFPHSFTPEQFKEIKKATLAVMICDLGQALTEIQMNPFKIPIYKNTESCSHLPRINLELWRELIETE
ncbi:peroxidase-like [Phymastichus coffea]|uniref:peroxidase-like n=1 Tax=Phymastichus coffea TaxID=108790 RepID=UPI00273C85FA|nr:peroxidase-like [Phymastichus coffea]